MRTSCQCDGPGFCELYGLTMSARSHAICSGASGLTPEKEAVYRGNWARAAKPTTHGVAPLITSTDCDHRGPVIRREKCTVCGGRTGERPVYECGIHGECFLSPPNDEAVLHWIEADKAGAKPAKQFCTLCRDRKTFSPQVYEQRRFDPERMLPSEHQFNNSLIMFEGRRVMAYRRGWNSARVVLCEIGDDGQPRNNSSLKIAAGIVQEDPRLFVFRGRLHVAYTVVHRQPQGGIYTDVGYARLIDTVDGWQVEREFLPQYAGRQPWEKNWGFFDHHGELHALYSLTPWRMLRLDGDRAELVLEQRIDFPGPARHRRGGASPILHAGEWYAWAHDVWGDLSRNRLYTASIYTFDAQTLLPLRATVRPVLRPDPADRWAPHTPEVIYPAGAYHSAGRWHLSYGDWDRWSAACEFDGGEIERCLAPVADPPPLSSLPYQARREGLELLLTSYGGSGLNWLAEAIDPQRRCRTPAWDRWLCHHARPLPLGVPAVVLLADPVIAWESQRRRGIDQQNARKMLGHVGDLAAAMAAYLDGWLSAPGATICRYEMLPETLPELWRLLGLRGSPPAWRERQTQRPAPGDYPPILDRLRERWEALPAIRAA